MTGRGNDLKQERAMDKVWTGERKAQLAALWAEGLSTAEIGRRMELSKNAVVGKAHRLALPARPSPIRVLAEGEVRKQPLPRPVLPGATLARHGGAMAGATLAVLQAVPVVRPVVEAPAPRPVVPVARYSFKSAPCCWPLGDPKQAGFRFCESAGVPGKPYCAAHEAKAWQRAPSAPAGGFAVVNARRATYGGLTASVFGAAAE